MAQQLGKPPVPPLSIPIKLKAYLRRKESKAVSTKYEDCETVNEWRDCGNESLNEAWNRSRIQSRENLFRRNSSSRRNELFQSNNASSIMLQTERVSTQKPMKRVNIQTVSVASPRRSFDDWRGRGQRTQGKIVNHGNSDESSNVDSGGVRVKERATRGAVAKSVSHSRHVSRKSKRTISTKTTSKRRKDGDPTGLGWFIKRDKQQSKDSNMQDVIKNNKKLGLPQEPIPFSYKSGEHGRAKGGRGRVLEARQVDGLYMYSSDMIETTETSKVRAMDTADKHLQELHKRLGYTKIEALARVEASYQTNKRKFEKLDEYLKDREERRYELNPKLQKGAAAVMRIRDAERKRLHDQEIAILEKIKQAKEQQAIEECSRRDTSIVDTSSKDNDRTPPVVLNTQSSAGHIPNSKKSSLRVVNKQSTDRLRLHTQPSEHETLKKIQNHSSMVMDLITNEINRANIERKQSQKLQDLRGFYPGDSKEKDTVSPHSMDGTLSPQSSRTKNTTQNTRRSRQQLRPSNRINSKAYVLRTQQQGRGAANLENHTSLADSTNKSDTRLKSVSPRFQQCQQANNTLTLPEEIKSSTKQMINLTVNQMPSQSARNQSQRNRSQGGKQRLTAQYFDEVVSVGQSNDIVTDASVAFMTRGEQQRFAANNQEFQTVQLQCQVIKKKAEMQHRVNERLIRVANNQSDRNRRAFRKINSTVEEGLQYNPTITNDTDREQAQEFNQMVTGFYEATDSSILWK